LWTGFRSAEDQAYKDDISAGKLLSTIEQSGPDKTPVCNCGQTYAAAAGHTGYKGVS